MVPGDELIGIKIGAGHVLPEWIDINGHMNVAYYVLAFDHGIDGLWGEFGITDEHIQSNHSSTFAVESHVIYRRELKEDDRFIVTAQILAYDQKRIHQFQRMYHAKDGYLAATAEWMSLHVDMKTRRVAPWPDKILDNIRRVASSQGNWAYPSDAGRVMRVGKPLFSAPSDNV